MATVIFLIWVSVLVALCALVSSMTAGTWSTDRDMADPDRIKKSGEWVIIAFVAMLAAIIVAVVAGMHLEGLHHG